VQEPLRDLSLSHALKFEGLIVRCAERRGNNLKGWEDFRTEMAQSDWLICAEFARQWRDQSLNVGPVQSFTTQHTTQPPSLRHLEGRGAEPVGVSCEADECTSFVSLARSRTFWDR